MGRSTGWDGVLCYGLERGCAMRVIREGEASLR